MKFMPLNSSTICHKHTTPRTHTHAYDTCTVHTQAIKWPLWEVNSDLSISVSFELEIAFDGGNYSLTFILLLEYHSLLISSFIDCVCLDFIPVSSFFLIVVLRGLILALWFSLSTLMPWWSYPIPCTIYKPTTTKFISSQIFYLNSHS